MQTGNPNLHIRRFEFKYLIDERDVDKIRRAVRNFVTYDQYVDKKTGYYRATSLYLDDLEPSAYYEKLAGLKYRRKFRIRFYGEEAKNSTAAFFEIKKRDETIIFKDRFESDIKTVKAVLVDREYEYLFDNEDGREFLAHLVKNKLEPNVLLSYKREAYFDEKSSNFRLTFDRNIIAKRVFGVDFDLNGSTEVYPGFVILEAKFNRIMPAWFGMIIKSFGLSYEAFSKYCFSVESCGIVTRIDLPSNLPWI